MPCEKISNHLLHWRICFLWELICLVNQFFFKYPKPSFGFSIFKNSFSCKSFKSFRFLCFIKICMVFLASLYSISSTLNLDTFDFQFPSGLFFLQSFHQTAHLHCLYCNSFCRCYFLTTTNIFEVMSVWVSVLWASS